jgi:hypothetical protein
VALIFGYGVRRQKHVSILIADFATGCKAPGFGKNISISTIVWKESNFGYYKYKIIVKCL